MHQFLLEESSHLLSSICYLTLTYHLQGFSFIVVNSRICVHAYALVLSVVLVLSVSAASAQEMSYSGVESEAMEMVAAMVQSYDAQGILDATNQGDLYGFVLDAATLEVMASGADLMQEMPPGSNLMFDGQMGVWAEYPALNPDTETTQQKRSWLYMHEGYIFGAGYYILDVQVQTLVQSAISEYERTGEDSFAALGEGTHVFVLDQTLDVVAKSSESRFGSLREADKTINTILDELQSEGSLWVAYMAENPAVAADQLTRTYIVEHDGYVFGAGYFLPDAAILGIVEETLYAYKTQGPDAVYENIKSFNHGDQASIISDGSAILAHGFDDEIVPNDDGVIPLPNVSEHIPRASALEVDRNLGEYGSHWETILMYHPNTKTDQVVRSVTITYDDKLFTSFYYVEDALVQSMTDHAIFNYKANGVGAFDIITPTHYAPTDKPYPFVENATTWETVAHAVDPDLVGVCCTDVIRFAALRPFEVIKADIAEDGVAWTTYARENPDTGTDQYKRSWLAEYDGYIFGAGYFLEDTKVQTNVYIAKTVYDRDILAAIAVVNSPDEPEAYTFIVDPDTGRMLAQGIAPIVIKENEWAAIVESRPLKHIMAELQTERGTWATYDFVNPLTGTAEEKRTWLVLHDDVVIGSGYYESEAAPPPGTFSRLAPIPE